MAAPEQLTLETAIETISSFQQRQASLAGDAEAFAARLLRADNSGGRAAVLEASSLASRTLVAFASATEPVVAGLGGPGGIAGGGTGGEGTGAGGGGGGGGGGATAEAAALRNPSAQQEETQGGGRGDDREEPPARKRARVAAGTGARAEAATAAQVPPNEAAPRAAALFSSPSSSSETFPAPSSSTSSEDDDDDGESSGGGDGADEGAAAGGGGAGGGGGGGQDDGFVFASQNVTKYMISERKIQFHSSVVRALRPNGGAPDSVQRGGTGAASTRKEFYRFAVFALRSAPARRGPSSWEPPARGAPGTQAFNTDFSSYSWHSSRHGAQYHHVIERVARCFRRRGDRRIAGVAEEEGALRDAEAGDELVFARRGMDRELFVWLVKKTQGCNEGGERGDDNEEPPARKRARVAAGAGTRAAAAAAAAAAQPSNEAEPRAAALFSSLASSSSETFPAPSSSTSYSSDDDSLESGGGDGAGEGAAAAGGGRGGGGRDDGFVFASQSVTKYMLSKKKIQFPLPVMSALRLNEGAADSVKRGTGGAESTTELYRFSVFALRSAPARRGPSSWEPPARDAPGTQAFNTDFSSYTFHSETYGTAIKHSLAGVARCFRRRGTRGVATAAQEGALRDAKVGDELVFARRGMDRELFVWLVKKTTRG